jgi:integrase
MPIASITRRDVMTVVNKAETTVTRGKGGAATANRTLAVPCACFSWAQREGLIEVNPALNTNKRKLPPKNRVLSIPWLVEIWSAVPATGFGDAVKLLMLTAQRRNEIGGLRWSELAYDVTRITLSPARQKNHGGRDGDECHPRGHIGVIDRNSLEGLGVGRLTDRCSRCILHDAVR